MWQPSLLPFSQNVYSVPLQIMYNPRLMQLLNVSNGTLLSQDGQAVALVHRDDSLAGILQLTASRPPGTSGISGNGSVFTLTFQAKTPGQGTLSIESSDAKELQHANPAGERLAGNRYGPLVGTSKPVWTVALPRAGLPRTQGRPRNKIDVVRLIRFQFDRPGECRLV